MQQNSHAPNRNVSDGRKGLYYIGNGIAAVGLLLFLSVFVTGAMKFANPSSFDPHSEGVTEPLRGVIGFLMMLGGGVLAGVGKSGVAGSGLKLDPQQAREELEPWSRMSGGMLRDTLDEVGIDLGRIGSKLAGADLPFDEKLRRLHALHQDGILTEEEYQREKQELLDSN